MKKQSPTIILTGGGSGGHITPLLSLARELKKQSPGCQIIYIGFTGDSFDSLRNASSDIDFTVFIKAGKFRRYHGESFLSHLLDVKTLLLNARDFFRVLRSIGTSLRIIGKFKPDVVFSKGSFVAVPVGIAARLRGVPIITHDSDMIPGLANRIIGRWAKVHATGMPAEHYAYPKDKTVFTGIPLSDKVAPVSAAMQVKYKEAIGLSAASQLLLVGSGGHGSRTVNQMVLKASPLLLSANPSLHMVHIAGEANVDNLAKEYSAVLDTDVRERVKVLGFTNEFYKYSGAADVIVGRAGATALNEFALQGKACIIIPSPFLTGGHQLKNAMQLQAIDAAVILDNDAEPDELIGVINELLNDSKRRHTLGQNLSKLSNPRAAEKLAKLVLDLAHGIE